MIDYAYDIETFPNAFTFRARRDEDRWKFEISDRRNDLADLIQWLYDVKNSNGRLVGFNNVGFDYPVIHMIMNLHAAGVTVDVIYHKAMSIINSSNRWENTIWPNERFIPQLDLFLIHHFDNMARSTSLKMLEFNMRSKNIEDLPFPVGKVLTSDEIDVLMEYNGHDVDETWKFYLESADAIAFREKLSEKHGRDFTNHNDTKIGKDTFIMRLGDEACFERSTGRKRPRQTPRATLPFRDVIFPYITFRHPEFNRILEWLKNQTLTAKDMEAGAKFEELNTKGVFKDVSCTVDGFKFDFGTGGIHGSVDSCIVQESETHALEDIDVRSYYPNTAIANGVYPEHLGPRFCEIYADLYKERSAHAKGTPENASLKLALNGVYGDSNNKYSPFYDPKYTMTITINGQLLLCILAEYLMDIPGLKMVQINTDGLSILYPREYTETVRSICKWWEEFTRLELESVFYSRMFIRDVNNYIAEYKDGGKLKRVGVYDYVKGWHQNHSTLVIPKAAEAALVHGTDIETFIRGHFDVMDFMGRAKVPRASTLVSVADDGTETTLQGITRYYVSNEGGALVKLSPPPDGCVEGDFKRKNGVSKDEYDLWHTANGNVWNGDIHTGNRSQYATRRLGYEVGWKVTPCNDMADFRGGINYDYYITEARKLVEPLL